MPVLLYAGRGDDRIDAGCTGEAIGLFEGMVRFFLSDDEFAFVIAHEMAHCLNGRPSRPAAQRGVSLTRMCRPMRTRPMPMRWRICIRQGSMWIRAWKP
ncbi:MAG: hypothetical protein E6R14_06385 [Thermomicrobiales bacterium]|jgi:hypothetical protein|nr:MAG: hypothetical protein E6R14_06385 [Thermomicrobiales bacterium]HAP39131.1 hypothetical protein [Nitrospira sp.]